MTLKKQNKKRKVIGFTAGSFDLCHAGHILMFKECKKVCDCLVVGLHSDPTIDRPHKNKPIMSMNERKIILAGVKYIDEIITYDTEADLIKLIKKVKPDVRIIGADWRGKAFTGKDLAEKLGHKIYYNSRNHNYSSTELRQRVYESEKNRLPQNK